MSNTTPTIIVQTQTRAFVMSFFAPDEKVTDDNLFITHYPLAALYSDQQGNNITYGVHRDQQIGKTFVWASLGDFKASRGRAAAWKTAINTVSDPDRAEYAIGLVHTTDASMNRMLKTLVETFNEVG